MITLMKQYVYSAAVSFVQWVAGSVVSTSPAPFTCHSERGVKCLCFENITKAYSDKRLWLSLSSSCLNKMGEKKNGD